MSSSSPISREKNTYNFNMSYAKESNILVFTLNVMHTHASLIHVEFKYRQNILDFTLK